MNTYYLVMFFIFGTIFGSFYNLVALRVVNGESISYPRSHCDNCKHVLSWYELIPILSFIIQKGKCRNCQTKLSYLYPFSEFACGILFMISFYSFGFSYDLIISLILVSTFILIIISDLNYLIIPDRFIIIPSIMIFIVMILDNGITKALKVVVVNQSICNVLTDDIDIMYISAPDNVEIGDKVYLISDYNNIDSVLQNLKTNRYYLLSILNTNLKRVYINQNNEEELYY